MKSQITTILAGTMLAVTILPFAQQLSAFAANSSVVTQGKVTCSDINALRKNSSNFAVYFDPAHAGKKNHFEVNAILSEQQRKDLGKNYSQTFSKFRFGTKPVQENKNQIKFEVRDFGNDLTKGVDLKVKKMTLVNNICQ